MRLSVKYSISVDDVMQQPTKHSRAASLSTVDARMASLNTGDIEKKERKKKRETDKVNATLKRFVYKITSLPFVENSTGKNDEYRTHTRPHLIVGLKWNACCILCPSPISCSFIRFHLFFFLLQFPIRGETVFIYLFVCFECAQIKRREGMKESE